MLNFIHIPFAAHRRRGLIRTGRMPEPITNPTPPATPRQLVPWTIFGVLLVVAIVSFFKYADRISSLLQALAER